jgi:hypothetical protein
MTDTAPDKTPVRRTLIVSLVALGVLIGGTLGAVKITTDFVLYHEATSAAQNWARYLAENVHDLEQIAAGEPPSSHSIGFFQFAQRAGLVFRYEIYNSEGYSQLVSDRAQTVLVKAWRTCGRSSSSARSPATRCKASISAVPCRPPTFRPSWCATSSAGWPRPIAQASPSCASEPELRIVG